MPPFSFADAWTRAMSTCVGGVVGRGLAGAAVELLADAGRLQGEQPRPVGDHEKGVRDTPRHERHAAGADSTLAAVDVDEDLALEDVDGLVGVGMAMQWGGLALRQGVFEQEERAVGVFGHELPRVEAASEERLLVAFAVGSDDRNW